MQITIGMPDPKEFTQLRLAQSGIQRHVAERGTISSKIWFPITPSIRLKLQDHWRTRSLDVNDDIKMAWAAATICFFGFFRSGQITVPSIKAIDSATHL